MLADVQVVFFGGVFFCPYVILFLLIKHDYVQVTTNIQLQMYNENNTVR